MTLRLLIADDEPLARQRLSVALSQMEEVEVVGMAEDGLAAAEQVQRLKPDVLLLDIQMPGANGIEVARALTQETRPDIIFVTAFDRFAVDAFVLEAVDYLLKPVKFDRLKEAIGRVVHRKGLREAAQETAELHEVVAALRSQGTAPSPQYETELWVPAEGRIIRLDVDRIEWVEAAGDYVIFHTESRSFLLKATMTALAERLDPARMIRVHRSSMVRLAGVKGVERPGKGALTLLLSSGAKVQVGPTYMEEVERALRLGR